MRLGLFGGSFDPVHAGHLALAGACQTDAKLDEVWFLPAAQQPLKPHGAIASEAHRVEMLELATADQPTWRVCRLEIERGGVSYTVDTLREIARRHPAAELFFLMGADSLHDLPRWRDPAAICELATPLVVARPSEPEPDFGVLTQFATPERVAAIRAAQVVMPPHAVASAEIRTRLAAGESIAGLVPAKVADYIALHCLYADRM